MIKTLKRDLLIFLISLFIFQGCKNPDLIGLEVQPGEDNLNTTVTDTVFIRSYSKREDSVLSSNLLRNLLGEFKDPVFGVTQASIAAQATLPTGNLNLGDSLQFDSVVLVMSYAGFYGDSSSVFTVNVNKLDQNLSDDNTYYSNKTFNSTDLLGTKTFKARPNDSVKIMDVKAGTDTLIKVKPQLRINLSSAFGTALMNESGTATFTDNASFLEKYKGFYMTATRDQGDGGIMYFDLRSPGSSNLVLYYRTTKNNVTDSRSTNFLMNSGSASANQYKHDYTGTPVQAELTDSTLGQNLVYIQPMSGVLGHVTMPYLSRLTDSGMIAVNKAELILTLESGSNTTYAAPPTMKMVVRTHDNRFSDLPSAVLISGTGQYKLNLTDFFQQLIINPDQYKEFIIYPVNREISGNRAIIGGGSNAVSPMKLRLVYTKLY